MKFDDTRRKAVCMSVFWQYGTVF